MLPGCHSNDATRFDAASMTAVARAELFVKQAGWRIEMMLRLCHLISRIL